MEVDLAKKPPIVIVGGFLSWPTHYRRFAGILARLSGLPVYIAPVTPFDWLRSVTLGRTGQFVFSVATTVDKALLSSESKRAIIVAHSAGGVASRVYIGGDPPYGGRRYSGHRRVSHLITLGSPHLVRDVWPLHPLHEANRLFPGALHSDSIRYISVAGSAVDGKNAPRHSRKAYEHLAGDPDVLGDGIVPMECALLPGSEHLVFDDLCHDVRRRGRSCYFSTEEVVERWWPGELRRPRGKEPASG